MWSWKAIMRRKRLFHQKVGEVLLLMVLDRHCRSHNIAAECCVGSRVSNDDFESRLSKAGGRIRGSELSSGSVLIVGGFSEWNILSEGETGLDG